MSPIPHPPRVCVCLLAAVLGIGPAMTGRLGAADPLRAKPKPAQKLSEPVVLIVAMDNYAKLKKLRFPVANGIEFAKAMTKLGYRVTFVTEKASLGGVKRALGNTAEAVFAVEDAAALEKAWRVWMEDHFLDKDAATQAPFGFVTFIGHGERRSADIRDRDIQFMAPADAEGKGGLSIRAMQDYCFQRHLPLVLMIDTCRKLVVEKGASLPEAGAKAELTTGTNPTPTQLLVLKDRGNRFGFAEERKTPLTIWCARDGEAAADVKRDMTTVLTRGLSELPWGPGRTFAAKRNAAGSGGGPFSVERYTDLSLGAWFRYGIIERNDFSKNTRQLTVEPGGVEQQQIFASTEKGRLAKLLALNRETVDLMGLWRHGAGEFTGEPTAQGIEIRRPAAAQKVRYALGVLNGEYDPKGKTIVIECTALRNGAQAVGNALPVLFQPGNAKNSDLYSGWNNRPVSVPFDQVVTVKIPLDQAGTNRLLDRITFSAVPAQPDNWPTGATLLIKRMRLCQDALAKEIGAVPAQPDDPIDLASRWWLCDVLRNEESEAQLVTTYQPSKASRMALRLEAKGSAEGEVFGRGGAVFPTLSIDKAVHAVAIQFADAGLDHDTKLVVAMYAKDKLLAETSIDLTRAGLAKPFVMTLKEDGVLDYIAVTTSDPKFKATITGIALVTKGGKPRK